MPPQVPGAPLLALAPYAVHLRAGEAKQVQLNLSPRDLSIVNEAGDRVIAPGDYQLSVGGGQPGKGAPNVVAHFIITGTKNLPE